MKQSQLFPHLQKTAPKGAESVNHRYLVRAGFIDQLMSGSWTLLPLGFRVVAKINQIIREELNAIGAQEILMPLLHPKKIWNETGRWDKADQIMYKLQDSRKKDFVLSFTHEEIVIDLLRKHISSYKDFPLAVYHFSTKFRNELRPRSGILRGREFLMKDLYSVHADEKEMLNYYQKVKKAYLQIFQRIGLEVRVTEAAGGVFTDSNTHEFQVLTRGGEDTVYYCDNCDWGVNQEIFDQSKTKFCPQCHRGKIKRSNSIEVGNIFPLGTWYSEKMRFYYTDPKGLKKLIWFASYGIGSSRVMGAAVEIFHDDRGIIWPRSIAPFDCHLLSLDRDQKAASVYHALTQAGIEVLYDDRPLNSGEKLAEADLIGLPFRLVISEKTAGNIEFKSRSSDHALTLSLDAVIKKLQKS